MDTFGTQHFVVCREAVLFRRLFCIECIHLVCPLSQGSFNYIIQAQVNLCIKPTVIQVVVWIVGYVFLKTPWQGAQTTIYCAVAEELEGVSGGYYGDCRQEELVTDVAVDDDVAEKLWRVSEEMVGLGM